MTSRAPDSANNGPRSKNRVPRGPGFSGEEVKFLFKTVETLLPGSMEEWDALARVYNTRFPLATRSGESLRRKFLKLGRSDFTERARRIKVLIQKRLRKEAGFQLPEDLEEEAEPEQQDLAADDGSGTDSDAHAGLEALHVDPEEEEHKQQEGEEDAVIEEESAQTRRRTSSVVNNDQDSAIGVENDSLERRGSAGSRDVVANAVEAPSERIDSVGSEERPLGSDRDPPQLSTGPPSDQFVYIRPAPASASTLPTRPLPHYPPPSEQHERHHHHLPEHQLSLPSQHPSQSVTVAHFTQRGYRESADVPPPSSLSTTLSSPTVVNRWFALEERRLLMEEQRMAFEQRRLAVEERRLQLLEQKMEADAAERNRLLEVLQLAMKNSSSNSGSRNAESSS